MDIQKITIEVEPVLEGQTDALFTIATETYSGLGVELEEIINVLETALQQFCEIRNKRK